MLTPWQSTHRPLCGDAAPAQQRQLLLTGAHWGLPSTEWAPGPVGLSARLVVPRVWSQRRGDPGGWASHGGLQLLCWHLPEGLRSASALAGVTWHSLGMLRITDQQPSPASPPEGNSGGPQQRRVQGAREALLTSILPAPLHWGFQIDLTNIVPQSQPSPLSPVPRASRLRTLAVGASAALPAPMGGDVPPLRWLWHFSGEQEGYAALPAFLLHTPALL